MSSEAVLKAGIDASGSKAGAAEFVHNTDDMAKGAEKASHAVEHTHHSVGLLGEGLHEIQHHLTELVAGFASFEAIEKATETILEFGEITSRIRGEMGLTEEQFHELEAAAVHYGHNSKFAADEAALGLQGLIRAGLDLEQAKEQLEVVGDAAVISRAKLADQAKQLGDIARVYKVPFDELERVADVTQRGAQLGRTTFSEFGSAIQSAGLSAQATGTSFEDMAAIIAAVGPAAGGASTAAEGLKLIIAQLSTAAGDEGAKATLKSLGLTLGDVNIRAHGLAGVFETLAKAGLTYDDALKLFGPRNASLAFQFSQNGVKIKEFSEKLHESDGAAKQAAETIEENVVAAFEKLQATVKTSIEQINTGESSFGHALRETILELNDLLAAVNDTAFGIEYFTRKMEEFPGIAKLLGFSDSDLADLKAGLEFAKALQEEIDKVKHGGEGGGHGEGGGESHRPIPSSIVDTPASGKLFDDLDLRQKAIDQTDEQAQKEKALAQFKLAAQKDYADQFQGDAEKQREAVEALTNDYAALYDQVQEGEAIKKKAEALTNAITTPIGSALDDGIKQLVETGHVDLKSLGTKLGQSLVEGLLHEIIVAPIVQTLSSVIQAGLQAIIQQVITKLAVVKAAESSVLLAAHGGTFDHGLVPYAYGGATGNLGHITQGPEIFPVGDGRTGIRGEAGPEIVAPAVRDASGKLGVRVVGGTGGPRVTNFYITTPDADSFRKSEQHIRADEKRHERRFQ